jgi:hypothetical protein
MANAKGVASPTTSNTNTLSKYCSNHVHNPTFFGSIVGAVSIYHTITRSKRIIGVIEVETFQETHMYIPLNATHLVNFQFYKEKETCDTFELYNPNDTISI